MTSTPKFPKGASFPRPTTPEARVATTLFLGWVSGVLDVAGVNEGRARLARNAC